MRERLQRAQRLINDRIGAVMRCSHRYTSEPWGFEDDEPFSNQVLVVDTELTPAEVLRRTQALECELGRDRAAEAEIKRRTGARYVSRPIDIDILFYDDRVIEEPDLRIPHPAIPIREFVLTPLCEVLREMKHPELGLTLRELKERLQKRQP